MQLNLEGKYYCIVFFYKKKKQSAYKGAVVHGYNKRGSNCTKACNQAVIFTELVRLFYWEGYKNAIDNK